MVELPSIGRRLIRRTLKPPTARDKTGSCSWDRIDVDSATPYAIPTDNPFVGDSAALDEICHTDAGASALVLRDQRLDLARRRRTSS